MLPQWSNIHHIDCVSNNRNCCYKFFAILEFEIYTRKVQLFYKKNEGILKFYEKYQKFNRIWQCYRRN